jgi:hypothetical protein
LREMARDPAGNLSLEKLLKAIAEMLPGHERQQQGDGMAPCVPPSPCSVGAPSRTDVWRSVSSSSNWTPIVEQLPFAAGQSSLSMHNNESCRTIIEAQADTVSSSQSNGKRRSRHS